MFYMDYVYVVCTYLVCTPICNIVEVVTDAVHGRIILCYVMYVSYTLRRSTSFTRVTTSLPLVLSLITHAFIHSQSKVPTNAYILTCL